MSVVKGEYNNLAAYTSSTLSALRVFDILTVLSPSRFLQFIFNIFYIFVQSLIVWTFKPTPPRRAEQPTAPLGRIAVIGAGLTGVSSAAHAMAHGFDVVIFEQGDRVGGIWTHVNSTSGLQLNSLLYRFHPAVIWPRTFPLRDEILSEIERIWKEYELESRTRFNTSVTSVRRVMDGADDVDPNGQGHARWRINEGQDGIFDAVIVTVGTCRKPKMVRFEGIPGVQEENEEETKEQADKGEDHRHEDHDEHTPDSAHSETPSDATFGKHGQDGQGSAWTGGKYEPPQEVERDQELKKDAGFPAPGEAYYTTPSADPQRDTYASSLREDHGNEEHHGDNEGDVFTKGPIVHSSELDRLSEKEVEGKEVIVIGSGASGVEAVETALAKGAKKTIMIARDDKWIIPRNIIVDTLIAAQPFGREMPLSFIWENIVIWWNYHGVQDLAPKHVGLFEGTPVVNDTFLYHVRAGRCDYVRGDIQRLTRNGVQVSVRGRSSKPGDDGEVKEFNGDVVVLATGYEQPDISFLQKDLFPEGYERPNLYLQNFSTEDWSILMTNSAYKNAIGTVGHFHIGIYTRILLTLLMDKDVCPSPKDMKLWVDVIRFLKKGAKGGALGFFTYMELTLWLLLFHVFRIDRIRWVLFIMQGWGVSPAECRQ